MTASRTIPRKECLGCAIDAGRGCIIEVTLTPSAALALVQILDFYPVMTMESAILCDILERRLRQLQLRKKRTTRARGSRKRKRPS